MYREYDSRARASGRFLRVITAALAAFLLFFFGSCQNANLESPRVDGAALVVTLSSTASAARTVTADIGAGVALWTLDFTRPSDGATKTVTGTGTRIFVTGLLPGTWDVAVSGTNGSGVEVVSGSATGIALAVGSTATVTVPLDWTATSGNGDLGFTVTFPASAGIDYAEGTINGTTLTPTVDQSGDPWSATFSLTGIPEGTYELLITLKRGGSGGTPAGTFVEAVNIFTGLVSDGWIAADGSLATAWNIPESGLFSSNAWLAGLTASSGTLPFSSNDLAPEVTSLAAAVSFVPTASIAGQKIEGSPDGTTWTAVNSGSSTPLAANPGTYHVRVTAPDGASVNVYDITLTRQYTLTYRANNLSGDEYATPAAGGVATTILDNANANLGFASPTNDGITLRFAGWNTSPGGTGTSYAPGGTITLSADAQLYAQWTVIGGKGPAGGLVFYDKGDYSNGWRYLEVYNPGTSDALGALTDYGTISNYGTGTAIGTGKANTALFAGSATGGSAYAAENLTAGGYDDWFIPSLDELDALRSKLWVGLSLGGFTGGASYATSSDSSSTYCIWALTMGATTYQTTEGMVATTSYRSRPVRAFAGTGATRVLAYSANGGTGSVSDAFFYPDGSTADVSGGSALSRAGYNFNGWNTKANGTGISYLTDATSTLDDTITLSADTVLYAQWLAPDVSDIISDISDGGDITLTSAITVNDLVAIGDAVAGASGPVTLDMTGVTLTDFPTSTFNGCAQLTSVTLPNTLTTIDNNCFNGCTALASVTMGNSVTTIGVGAFQDCTLLSSISLPSSVTSIGNNAFASTGMTLTGGTFTCAATTPPALGSNVFGSIAGSFSIKVPAASLSLYQSAWSAYVLYLSGY